MTEAELAIEEKLRRKKEEQEQIWQEYLEQREKQREKEEDELKKLRERQVSFRSQFMMQLVDMPPRLTSFPTVVPTDSKDARPSALSRSV